MDEERSINSNGGVASFSENSRPLKTTNGELPSSQTVEEMISLALDGCVAVVTGGSRGIGRAICLALAEAGADILLTYERRAADGEDVVRAIEKKDRCGVAIQGDVRRKRDMDAMVREAIVRGIPAGRLGSVDEVAAMVVFLASDLASYVTGQVIFVNGGGRSI